MKNKLSIITLFLFAVGILILSQCNEKKPLGNSNDAEDLTAKTTKFNGFESQIKWGEHLVLIGSCHDCHTPKKMTSHGPVLDTALWLSGRPADMPRIDIDRKEVEEKGLAVAMDLTEWVGPWGVSFAANLTPDPTGIGNWTEDQFIYALREGTSKGIPGSRPLLPPMPWEMIRNMTDDEIKAVFAYLKSINPINNIVPAPVPPTGVTN
jgi:mono/diheme cytochrome c family protein